MNGLEIEALTKRYRSGAQALDGVSLTIGPGVLGLLGPNGAGKLTLMRIVSTVLKPTSGSVRWNGIDVLRSPDALRSQLGYLPQDCGVYPNLSAREFLRYVATLKGMPTNAAERRITELLEELNLGSAGNRPLGAFSGGMKQRVGIAQALLNDPQIAIVDEPTVGLDPEERSRFRDLIGGIAGERIVILFDPHRIGCRNDCRACGVDRRRRDPRRRRAFGTRRTTERTSVGGTGRTGPPIGVAGTIFRDVGDPPP